MGRRRRSLARILSNAATAVSLALCLATCVLWVRSYRVGESIHWNSVTTDPPGVSREFELHSWDGRFAALWGRAIFPPFTVAELVRWRRWWASRDRPVGWRYVRLKYVVPPGGQVEIGASGFGRGELRGDYESPWAPGKSVKQRGRYVAAPYWFLAALLALPFLSRALGRWRSIRTPQSGRCSSCGYDLRATPDRCPECGTIPS